MQDCRWYYPVRAVSGLSQGEWNDFLVLEAAQRAAGRSCCVVTCSRFWCVGKRIGDVTPWAVCLFSVYLQLLNSGLADFFQFEH